jgi:hypothetical protein
MAISQSLIEGDLCGMVPCCHRGHAVVAMDVQASTKDLVHLFVQFGACERLSVVRSKPLGLS